MVFDLYPMFPLLSAPSRQTLINSLQASSPRATVTLHKLRYILSSQVSALHGEYAALVDADGKPEKGERKMADDLVVLIYERDQSMLYRIGLMEFAVGRSPYNFDLQLGLGSIYHQLGLGSSFSQVIKALGMKGVQLESMGYLLFRHVVDWCDLQ